MNPSSEKRLELCRRPENRRPVMYQKWKDLLFVHWEIDPAAIQKTLPPGLTVDTFAGKAYLGVVPFFMCDIRPRCCPAVPGISNFLEMNVRTYVFDEQGTPGVWFYSLDANQRLTVRVARRFFHLPYFDAQISATKTDSVSYECHRSGSADSGSSSFKYQATDEMERPKPDSLEFFLVERYLLFAHDSKRAKLYSGRVFHTPYPLRRVEFEIKQLAAISLAGFDLPDRPPDHAAMSHGVDVDIFALQALNS
jgi:uncharacterized protein YqjF (DUF2071 family)